MLSGASTTGTTCLGEVRLGDDCELVIGSRFGVVALDRGDRCRPISI